MPQWPIVHAHLTPGLDPDNDALLTVYVATGPEEATLRSEHCDWFEMPSVLASLLADALGSRPTSDGR